MKKLSIINKIKNIYNQGGNIMEFLRKENSLTNDVESILISYDFQAGSYIEFASENEDYVNRYIGAICRTLNKLGSFQSIMEVGVGEATTMSPLMKMLDPENSIEKFGFDISWSRIRYGLTHAEKHQQSLNLFTADLFNIPLPDSCIDVLYTSHSLEPNGGLEKIALMELYRVTKKYIVLLEPDYEGASPEAKERMIKHGYVKNLVGHAKEMGWDVVEDCPFEVSENPLNPTRLIIIKKKLVISNAISFICPISRTLLIRINSQWYSKETGLLYPEINGVPCLMENNAVLATKYLDFNL